MSSVIKSTQYDGVNNVILLPVDSPEFKIQEKRAAEKKASEKQNEKNTFDHSISEAQEQSKQILSEAFSKAKQIMEAAQTYSQTQIKDATERMNQECVQMKRQSHDEGYALGMIEGRNAGKTAGYREGYEEGLQKAAGENQQKADELSLMLETVEKKKAQILEKFSGDLEELAISIAKKIIKKELSMDENVMRSIIVNAIDSYRNQDWVRICVSKNTADILLQTDNSIIEALKNVSDSVKVVASPDMEDTDCIIDMPEQIIDAGIDTQLENIRKAL